MGDEQLGALVGECRNTVTSAGLVLFGLYLLGAEFGLHRATDGLDSGGVELEAAVEAGDGRFYGVEANDSAAALPPLGLAAQQVVVVGAAVTAVATEHQPGAAFSAEDGALEVVVVDAVFPPAR